MKEILPGASQIAVLRNANNATHRLFLAEAQAAAPGLGVKSYGPSLQNNFRRAASYVDRILKGARPGDLPIEQPNQLDLVINLRAAKALGLAMASSLMLRTDRVIE